MSEVGAGQGDVDLIVMQERPPKREAFLVVHRHEPAVDARRRGPMIPQTRSHQQSARPGDADVRPAPEVSGPDAPADRVPAEAPSRMTDHAARAVMHPEWHDPDWRYYHGAWAG